MSQFGQLARDVERLLSTLTTLEIPVADAQRSHLEHEFNLRLAMIENAVPSHPRLLRERIRVGNELRRALAQFARFSRPTVDVAVLKRCVETIVLPYLNTLMFEEEQRFLSPVETAASGLSGVVLGNWRLDKEIGRGATSVVYRAENTLTGMIACVKVIPQSPDNAAEQQERFLREVRVPALIAHPALVPVLDAGSMAGVNYIVMRLVVGLPLNVWAQRRKTTDIVMLFQRVLAPIAACHEHGYVHRDIKPNNVLVADGDEVCILDFGMTGTVGRSRHTTSKTFIGTVDYVSPEQAMDGRDATPQSDIWSLGVVLYEVLSGLKVFPQSDDREVLSAVLTGKFAPPEDHLPAALAAIVRRCLQREPANRFSSVKHLSDTLKTALAELAVRRPDGPSPAPLPKQGKPESLGVRAVPVNLVEDTGSVPISDPTISPYTLQIDSCTYCTAIGMWSGNRCTRCGRDRGTD